MTALAALDATVGAGSSRLDAAARVATNKGITARNIELVFGTGGKRTQAIKNLSLDVAGGEFVSIVGPSGCGKSSFLRMVLGLTRPTAGQLDVGGTAVTGPRRDVGIVFQSPVLLPWRSVLKNVVLPATISRLPKANALERAGKLLQQVGLGGFERHYPFQLSGGMQHRVAIARGLLQDPDILLMDEPFAALDALTREQMSYDLQQIWLAQRKTILFVTHGISEAVFLSSKIVLMSSRPARVVDVFTNSQPYPRTLDDMHAPEFVELTREIRKRLDART